MNKIKMKIIIRIYFLIDKYELFEYSGIFDYFR